MDKHTRLKIAIQKSGRLTDLSLDLLTRCGLKFSRGKDQLICHGENMPLDILLVRDDDIPDLVQQDVADLGIVGLNVIEEKRLAFEANGIQPLFEQLMLLDHGRCRLCIAVPDEFKYQGAQSLQGKRIATTYPNILGSYLQENKVKAEIVTLIRDLARQGKAVLIVASELAELLVASDRIIVMSDGVLVQDMPRTALDAGAEHIEDPTDRLQIAEHALQ